MNKASLSRQPATSEQLPLVVVRGFLRQIFLIPPTRRLANGRLNRLVTHFLSAQLDSIYL